MKYLNKFLLYMVLCFMFLFTADSKLYSGKPPSVPFGLFGSHNLGIYSQEVKTSTYRGSRVRYPNGHYMNQMNDNRFFFMVAKDFVGAEGASPQPFAWAQFKGAWRRYTDHQYILKNNPPSIKVDGFIVSPPFGGEIDPSIKSDVKIILGMTMYNTVGGVFTETSRSYANQNHNSYVLWDLNYKFLLKIQYGLDDEAFLPEQTLNCFISNAWFWRGHERGVTTYRGRFYHRTLDWHVADKFPSALKAAGKITNPASIRDELPVSYAFGSNDASIKKPKSFLGDQWTGDYSDLNDRAAPVGYETGSVDGEFTNYAYIGQAVLHADKSAAETDDDLAKPRYMGRLKIPQNLAWFGIPMKWPLEYWDWSNQEGIQPPGWELGYDDAVSEAKHAIGSFQTIGPYLLNDGEDVSVVSATAVGGIDFKLAWSYGNEFMKWYRDGEGNFDNAKMNELIDTGLDSMVQNLDRAYWAYSRNYDIPDPSPAPDIEVTGGPDEIYVKWGYPDADYFKDPDTGIPDFGEWRVYRKLGNLLVNHEEDRGKYSYELVYSTTDKDETEWTDTGVQRGQVYHYYVTSVDDGSQNTDGLIPGQPLESTAYANRTLADVKSFKPGEPTTENILIVPNPYSVGTSRNVMGWTGRADDIHIINLPPYCTIKIYTATGDLIKTFEHTSGSADETWSDMRTDWNQQPVSGVYILVVDNAKDLDKNPLPKKFAKFVIVR